MDSLTSFSPRQVAPDTFVLPAFTPLPFGGVLPLHAFLIRGAEPVLIDTGAGPLRDAFVRHLETLVDLRDLRYVWLTHTDPDHTGALDQVLRAAPQARVVVGMMGAAKFGLTGAVPAERLHVLAPGDRLDLAGRTLTAVRPPTYDAPETIAAFDGATRTLFAADSFASVLQAPAESADAIAPAQVREGMVGWATVDTPWLGQVDTARFRQGLESIRRLQPERILSSHLPPATGMTDALLAHLAATAEALVAAEALVGAETRMAGETPLPTEMPAAVAG